MAFVLIVEDEISIAKLLEDVLTDEGHRVATAGNGRRALDLMAEAGLPDVVVSDFMMPVMDGAALLGAMRSDERLRAIPVILTSSLAEQTVAERTSGYAAFLRKPFKIVEIIRLVDELSGRPA